MGHKASKDSFPMILWSATGEAGPWNPGAALGGETHRPQPSRDLCYVRKGPVLRDL